mmetsp:Transcript_537/g.1028  ORF Transcript_537/g.1028 Transcript_537/m.1028 type:complete len:208 (+) Transcript_537:565-1188(+)
MGEGGGVGAPSKLRIADLDRPVLEVTSTPNGAYAVVPDGRGTTSGPRPVRFSDGNVRLRGVAAIGLPLLLVGIVPLDSVSREIGMGQEQPAVADGDGDAVASEGGVPSQTRLHFIVLPRLGEELVVRDVRLRLNVIRHEVFKQLAVLALLEVFDELLLLSGVEQDDAEAEAGGLFHDDLVLLDDAEGLAAFFGDLGLGLALASPRVG